MGNYQSYRSSDVDKKYSPNYDERRNADKIPQTRPDRTPTLASKTKILLEPLDARHEDYKDYKTRLRILKDDSSPETEQQVLQMMYEKERDLHTLEQELQHKHQKEVNSNFYRLLKEKEHTLQTALSANDKLTKENDNLKAKLSEETNYIKELFAKKTELLFRVCDLTSSLRKYENPAITDLSDENRPTNLGQNFRQLYEEEWKDAYEFLTEERSKDNRLDDGDAIDMLYAMLKNCNEVCAEGLKGQHVALAQLVSDPAYLKTISAKPQVGKDLISFDQDPQGTFCGNRAQIVNSNTRPNCAKLAWMPDMNDAGQVPGAKRPATGSNSNDAASGQLGVKVEYEVPAELEVPFKEFSKSVAAFVLRHVAISDILSAVNKDKQFQEDVLQNTSVQTYLEKCFRLCWLMQVQHPPMLMGFGTTHGADFDHSVFETYTNRGAKISRVVWPPVYLHKDGPLVCKGYADGTR